MAKAKLKEVSTHVQTETKPASKQGGARTHVQAAAIPAMPVENRDPASIHRPKIPDPCDAHWFQACVARSVSRREILTNAMAKASLDKEWTKLRNQGCWDESKVREWKDVAAETQRRGKTAHVGRIFDICVEKNA